MRSNVNKYIVHCVLHLDIFLDDRKFHEIPSGVPHLFFHFESAISSTSKCSITAHILCTRKIIQFPPFENFSVINQHDFPKMSGGGQRPNFSENYIRYPIFLHLLLSFMIGIT